MRLTSACAKALFVSLLLTGCSSDVPHRHDFIALGTQVSISVYGADQVAARHASRTLEKHLLARGTDWYAYADGELAAINTALREGRETAVSPELAALLRRATALYERSGGDFHPGLGELMQVWGLNDLTVDAPRPSTQTLSTILEQMVSPADIRWDNNILKPARVQFDLGGIAKGALLAESAEILARFDVHHAIVNLGGDLLVIGRPAGRDAQIGIRSPFSDRALGGLAVHAGEAVVTSGNYARAVMRDGKQYSHILDPATGVPVAHTASVTVVNTDPVLADAAATALLVGGPARFTALTQALDLEFALLITQSGDVRLTPGFRDRLNLSLDL